MTTESDIPQTEAEAIKRGYQKHVSPISKFQHELKGIVRRDSATLDQGALCLQSNCTGGTMTVCYYNGSSCDNCYIIPCS